MYYHFEAIRGDTFQHRLSARQAVLGADPLTAATVDLTGCTARMVIRDNLESPILAEFTTENGKLSFEGSPQLGTLAIREEAAATALWGWDASCFSLRLLYPDGTLRSEIVGDIKAIESIANG